tara:strand:+ start:266 stop:607 length:342 start_codon:yes stop_codon:yes gene_type:complete
MAIYHDAEIKINLNELISMRNNYLYRSGKIKNHLSEEDVDCMASSLPHRLTWDALYGMVDSAIFEYLDEADTHYGERTIETIEVTREQEFKKNFKMVKLESSAWTIEVPLRKK